MIGRVEEVRKETEEIWRKKIENDPLYKDVFKSSQPEEKEGVSCDQKDETQTGGHLEGQGNTTLDIVTGDNPPVIDSSSFPEIQKDDTAPSGNIGAHDKGDGAKKMKLEKVEIKVAEVDKGKGVVDPGIDTRAVTGTPSQTSINLDGPLNLGHMSPAEKLMLAATVQAQASQDLVKSKFEDKRLILMSVKFLQKVAMNVQLDFNASPFGKLLQLINSVNTSFDSLEKTTTK